MAGEHLQALQYEIFHRLLTFSQWKESVIVEESRDASTSWRGTVHVFEIYSHPSQRCYGWSIGEADGAPPFAIVAHDQGADSPRAAVQSYFSTRQHVA